MLLPGESLGGMFFRNILSQTETACKGVSLVKVFPNNEVLDLEPLRVWGLVKGFYNGEFDPGSERTLAAWIRHASRARKSFGGRVEWRTGE